MTGSLTWVAQNKRDIGVYDMSRSELLLEYWRLVWYEGVPLNPLVKVMSWESSLWS